MVPVCDKRYHIYNRFRHFWAEIRKLWNYPFRVKPGKLVWRVLRPGALFKRLVTFDYVCQNGDR